jgi:hypothetical protein
MGAKNYILVLEVSFYFIFFLFQFMYRGRREKVVGKMTRRKRKC